MPQLGDKSKPLGHPDDSGWEFTVEMLDGDKTAAIDFDRLQYHPVKGYIIFEFLLCEERPDVTPWTSHPRRYWHKNRTKFLALWNATKAMNATLYLVNYAKRGTANANEILIMKVSDVSVNGVVADECKTTRDKFQRWFRDLNAQCLGNTGVNLASSES